MSATGNPQWARLDRGSFSAVQATCTNVGSHLLNPLLDEAEMPAVLYDKAPAEYIRLALPALADAVAQMQWAIRMLTDEASARRLVPQRELAALSGVSFSTIQRWAKEPALIVEGRSGPGTLADGRKNLPGVGEPTA